MTSIPQKGDAMEDAETNSSTASLSLMRVRSSSLKSLPFSQDSSYQMRYFLSYSASRIGYTCSVSRCE